jgi:hypothetical protein
MQRIFQIFDVISAHLWRELRYHDLLGDVTKRSSSPFPFRDISVFVHSSNF